VLDEQDKLDIGRVTRRACCNSRMSRCWVQRFSSHSADALHFRNLLTGRPERARRPCEGRLIQMNSFPQKPSAAFIGASWVALIIGILAFLIGLSNSGMVMIEKGYYFTCLMFGLFAAVSLQKSVRDRLEGILVTALYFGIAWVAVGLSILLTAVALWNSSLDLASKGFYAMAYVLSLFAAVAVQKNVRDVNVSESVLVTRTPDFTLEQRTPDPERLPITDKRVPGDS
jgi:uncharacterized membrane protein YiaA